MIKPQCFLTLQGFRAHAMCRHHFLSPGCLNCLLAIYVLTGLPSLVAVRLVICHQSVHLPSPPPAHPGPMCHSSAQRPTVLCPEGSGKRTLTPPSLPTVVGPLQSTGIPGGAWSLGRGFGLHCPSPEAQGRGAGWAPSAPPIHVPRQVASAPLEASERIVGLSLHLASPRDALSAHG